MGHPRITNLDVEITQFGITQRVILHPNSLSKPSHSIKSIEGVHGIISPNETINIPYDYSGVTTFNIIPHPGYEVNDVVVDEVSQGSIPNYTFPNDRRDHTISATFRLITYTILATAGEHGTIDPSGAVQVPYHEDQTFNIIADSDYTIDTVTIDGQPDSSITGTTASYTFHNVQADHTIAVTFKPIPAPGIQNGGFEQDFNYWTNGGWGIDAECSHSGVKSAAYRGFGGDNSLSQEFNATGASSIRFWYSRHSLTSGDLVVYLDSEEMMRVTGQGTGSPDWFLGEIPVPSAGIHELEFVVAGYSTWTNIDDVELVGPGLAAPASSGTSHEIVRRETTPAIRPTPWQWDFKNETNRAERIT